MKTARPVRSIEAEEARIEAERKAIKERLEEIKRRAAAHTLANVTIV
jgi:hypothetical protein